MVPFKVLRQKRECQSCVALKSVLLRSGKKIQAMPTRHDLGTMFLLGVLFKVSDKQPHLFHTGMEIIPGV